MSALTVGCGLPVEPTPASPDAAGAECVAAVEALLADGALIDAPEADARMAELASLCGSELASESGFAVDDKSDGEGTGTWVEQRWFTRGADCYAERDLDCLESNFRFLVWVWRYYEGYTHAPRAMEKFLDCDTAELRLTEAEYFGASSSPGRAFDETATQPWELPQTTASDLRERLFAGNLPFDAVVALDPLLVVSRNEDIRYTVGRTVVARTAQYTRSSEAGLHFDARFTFRDPYDFHPDRRDMYSSGQTYAQVYPYHSWAALLVDEGRACPFVVTGDYARSVVVTP